LRNRSTSLTLKILANKISIPIALGENYYSLDESSMVIAEGVANIIQPDINHGGGVTQIKKIASIAEGYDVKFAPHLHLIIGFVVSLHMLTSFPNGYIAEYTQCTVKNGGLGINS